MLKPNDTGYAKTLEFCATNLDPKYHSFPDVHPSHVEELYQG